MQIFRVIFLLIAAILNAKTVYFVHIGGIDSSKYFYDYTFYRDEVSKPFVLLREAIENAGFDVAFTQTASGLEDVAAIISINDVNPDLLANLTQYPTEKCLLLILEPPIVLPALHQAGIQPYFGKIFNLFDDPIDNSKYFKFYYPQPRMKMNESIPDFSQKRLSAMIAGNKNFGGDRSLYPERRKVIAFFAGIPGEFDLFGPDWAGYEAWNGYVASKWETLKNYKFTFCYENFANQRGYITEKIFDSMVAGSVPIYWGADNITDYIPKECFIDRRAFSSETDLYDCIKNMDRVRYEAYLEAIRDFFKSPQAQLFSSEYFIKTMMSEILRLNQDSA